MGSSGSSEARARSGLSGGDVSESSKIKIGKMLPSGTTKHVYEYGSNQIIAFIVRGDPIETVANEAYAIGRLERLGFETQKNAQVCDSYGNERRRHALVMDSWKYLESVGMQIRDSKKGESCYGHSMIFGTMENINKDRAAGIMKKLSGEMVKLVINGIILDDDSYNIVIKDTDGTADHDRSVPELFDVRKQEVRLFLSDLTDAHHWERNYIAMFDHDTKMPSRKGIMQLACRVYWGCEYALIGAVTDEEIDLISCNENYGSNGIRSELWKVFKEIKDDMLRDIVDQVCAALEGKYEEKCRLIAYF